VYEGRKLFGQPARTHGSFNDKITTEVFESAEVAAQVAALELPEFKVLVG
jgi:hypothetical protein